MLEIGTKIGTLSKLQVRNKNERTRNVIRKTWNNDQHMKVIYTVHEFGTIDNNGNIKQVKKKRRGCNGEFTPPPS